jgi:hypothetical protein
VDLKSTENQITAHYCSELFQWRRFDIFAEEDRRAIPAPPSPFSASHWHIAIVHTIDPITE